MSYKSFSIFAVGFGLTTIANAISRYSDYQTYTIISLVGNLVLSAYFVREITGMCNQKRTKPLVQTTLAVTANVLTCASGFSKLLGVMQPVNNSFDDTQKAILTAIETTTNCVWIANFLFFTMYGKADEAPTIENIDEVEFENKRSI